MFFDSSFFSFSLFRINEKRIQWIEIIERHQLLKKDAKLYICDLHFNQNDVHKKGKISVLQKNAKPNIMYVLLLYLEVLLRWLPTAARRKILYYSASRNMQNA